MCDRYLGCGDAIAIWGCGGCAIAVFGMWGLRLKLGALMTVTKRRVLIAINSSCPYQHIYATAYRCLQLLSTTTELITYWLFTNSLPVKDFSPDFCVINFVQLLTKSWLILLKLLLLNF